MFKTCSPSQLNTSVVSPLSGVQELLIAAHRARAPVQSVPHELRRVELSIVRRQLLPVRGCLPLQTQISVQRACEYLAFRLVGEPVEGPLQIRDGLCGAGRLEQRHGIPQPPGQSVAVPRGNHPLEQSAGGLPVAAVGQSHGLVRQYAGTGAGKLLRLIKVLQCLCGVAYSTVEVATR